MLKMFKALTLASVALVGLAACNGARDDAVKMAESPATDGRGFMIKKYNGRDYAVFVPRSYNKANKYPMIVFLHGVGEGGSDIKKPLQVGLAPFVADQVNKKGDFDFVVIFPQSPTGSWDENSSHAADVIGMIEATAREYSVDRDRVSLTGLSTGGYGTWAIGAKYSSYFAALVPMGSSAACTNQGPTLAKMNVWAIENFGDPFGGFGANDRSVASVEAAGGKPKHTTYPSFMSHNCWEKAYGDGELFAWLRATSRKGTTVPTSVTPSVTPAKSTSDATPAKAAPAAAAKATPAKTSSVETNGRAVVPPTPF